MVLSKKYWLIALAHLFRLQCQKCPVSVFETKNLLCASAGSAAAWLPPNIYWFCNCLMENVTLCFKVQRNCWRNAVFWIGWKKMLQFACFHNQDSMLKPLVTYKPCCTTRRSSVAWNNSMSHTWQRNFCCEALSVRKKKILHRYHTHSPCCTQSKCRNRNDKNVFSPCSCL